jgi:hypothetical protein
VDAILGEPRDGRKVGSPDAHVVVAKENKDRDAGPVQPAHLAAEKQTRVEVRPVAVVQIPRDDHEVDLLVDGSRDQLAEGLARGAAQEVGRCVLIGAQSPQGTVEMDICCMDKTHVLDSFFLEPTKHGACRYAFGWEAKKEFRGSSVRSQVMQRRLLERQRGACLRLPDDASSCPR